MCAEQHFNTCKDMGIKLDNKHNYDVIPKSAEMSHEGKVDSTWNVMAHGDAQEGK